MIEVEWDMMSEQERERYEYEQDYARHSELESAGGQDWALDHPDKAAELFGIGIDDVLCGDVDNVNVTLESEYLCAVREYDTLRHASVVASHAASVADAAGLLSDEAQEQLAHVKQLRGMLAAQAKRG